MLTLLSSLAPGEIATHVGTVLRDGFNWWSGIWIPLGLGLLTVTISIVSIWFAIAAFHAARDSNRPADQIAHEAARDKRLSLARHVDDVLDVEFGEWRDGRHDGDSWTQMNRTLKVCESRHELVPTAVIRQAMYWHELIEYNKLKPLFTWLIVKNFNDRTEPMLAAWLESGEYRPERLERTADETGLFDKLGTPIDV